MTECENNIEGKMLSSTNPSEAEPRRKSFLQSGLTAAGDQAKPKIDVKISSLKFITSPKSNEDDKISKILDGHPEDLSRDESLGNIIFFEKEEVILEDHSPVSEEGSDVDDDGDVEDDIFKPNLDASNDYICRDPGSLIICGQKVKLHTPPRQGLAKVEGSEIRQPPEGEEAPPEKSKDDPSDSQPSSESTQQPSSVIEKDVIEYVQSLVNDVSNVEENGTDCGAGDAAVIVESEKKDDGNDGDDDNDDDDDAFTSELSQALSSAAMDAALAEINYEAYVKEQNARNLEDLCYDDDDDDVVVIVPEPHELNYENVPDGASLEYSLQEAANARNQLDAQADFLENSLNCLEITLDKMSLNEAVMPDGSVVFLKDQLRKARTGHLLRAWEKNRGIQDNYISDEDLDKPLNQLQRELYQDQINHIKSANDEMRTAVTQATLQEQALRGQARQMQQTFTGLEDNIAMLSQELLGLQNRQKHLQNTLMEERRAKEVAIRENERMCRQSSSSDMTRTTGASSYEDQAIGQQEQLHQQQQQPYWLQGRPRSASSAELLTTPTRPPPGSYRGQMSPGAYQEHVMPGAYQEHVSPGAFQGYMTHGDQGHMVPGAYHGHMAPGAYQRQIAPRWHRERVFIQPPPWRRGRGRGASYRPFPGRRPYFGATSFGGPPQGGPPRPFWPRGFGGGFWRRNGTYPAAAAQRPWERRRPPFLPRPGPMPQAVRPGAPIPFAQPFKRETEDVLRSYFHKMGRVENLLRERGFAKGPAAERPVPVLRPDRQIPPRFQPGLYRGRAFPSSYGWRSSFTRGGLASRSVPNFGYHYREGMDMRGDWLEHSRSQTVHNATSDQQTPANTPASTPASESEIPLAAAASA